MSFYDFQAGHQQARFGSVLREMRAVDAARDWEQYAHQLEAKLAQAQAETLAARIQRNTYSRQLSRVVGELAKVAPNHPAANDVALIAEGRREVDEEAAKNGIMIDRSNPQKHVVRRLR